MKQISICHRGACKNYTNDEIGRRIARIDSGEAFAETAFERYSYNERSEVIGSQRFYGSDVSDLSRPVTGRTFGYGYDPIGNFASNRVGGVSSVYEANALNEYESVADVSAAPPAVAALSHDADGNLLTNGVWSYEWDSRNRLASVSSNGVPVAENVYDALSRRVLKRSADGTHVYLYDGWNLVRETVLDGSGAVVRTQDFYWGKDLSGTLQGAGGVGGLLAVRRAAPGAAPETFLPLYDNLGNVVAYLDEAGAPVASYAYDAFGRQTASSGPLADTFLHRFSTKPFDPETGLLYYGYRHYSPALGRWLNRDPIGPVLEPNEYGFCLNNGNIFIDDSGRVPILPPLLLILDFLDYGISRDITRTITRIKLYEGLSLSSYVDERCECRFLPIRELRETSQDHREGSFWIRFKTIEDAVTDIILSAVIEKVLSSLFSTTLTIADISIGAQEPTPDDSFKIVNTYSKDYPESETGFFAFREELSTDYIIVQKNSREECFDVEGATRATYRYVETVFEWNRATDGDSHEKLDEYLDWVQKMRNGTF